MISGEAYPFSRGTAAVLPSFRPACAVVGLAPYVENGWVTNRLRALVFVSGRGGAGGILGAANVDGAMLEILLWCSAMLTPVQSPSTCHYREHYRIEGVVMPRHIEN